jgi:hypothetical protein
MFGALNFTFNRRNICFVISATLLTKLFLFSYVEKRGCFRLLLIHFNWPRKIFFEFFIFTLLKKFLFGFKNYFFSHCRLQRLKNFNAVADSGKKF